MPCIMGLRPYISNGNSNSGGKASWERAAWSTCRLSTSSSSVATRASNVAVSWARTRYPPNIANTTA